MMRNSSILYRLQPAQWAPQTIQVFGETLNKADQMPGGINSPVWLKDVQYTTGGAWTDINTDAGATDPNIHGAAKLTSKLYKIWDKACLN